jgi:hypothetical protein
MSLSNEALVLGFLGRQSILKKLSEIYEGLQSDGVSKSTLYRVLQKFVDDGIVLKENEGYLLVAKGRTTVKATDLARLNEMNPVHMENTKGLRFRAYATDDLEHVNWGALRNPIKTALSDILTQIDPALSGTLDSKSLSSKAIQKLVGLKFAILVSFDGTDFTTLAADDIVEKRRDAMKLLAVRKKMTLQGMAEELHLNVLEVRQLLHPLLASGYAVIDEEGLVSYTLEVTPD